MMRFPVTLAWALLLGTWPAVGLGQTQPAVPATATAAAPTTTQAAEVAATVDGHPILASVVEGMVREHTPKQILQHAQADTALVQQRAYYLNMLVANELLDGQVTAAGIKITDAEMAEAMEAELQGYLSDAGLTRDAFDTQLRAQRNVSLEQFLAKRITDPSLGATQARKRLIEQRFPDVGKVTDDEIKQYYEKHRDRRLTRPEQVRVSHILVATDNVTPQQKADARQKIEQILTQAREPGADFAALAARYSDSPAKAKGGDLGFTPRRGGLAEPLAAAAFSLEVGQISDVIETEGGYHILKATDKAGPRTIPLEEARLGILQTLRDQKLRAEMKRYADELRTKAQIVYSPGWGPPSGMSMTPVAVSQPASAPASAPVPQ